MLVVIFLLTVLVTFYSLMVFYFCRPVSRVFKVCLNACEREIEELDVRANAVKSMCTTFSPTILHLMSHLSS